MPLIFPGASIRDSAWFADRVSGSCGVLRDLTVVHKGVDLNAERRVRERRVALIGF